MEKTFKLFSKLARVLITYKLHRLLILLVDVGL